MPPVGFEPTISAGERPHTYALDRAATGIGVCVYVCMYVCMYVCVCVYVYIYIYIYIRVDHSAARDLHTASVHHWYGSCNLPVRK